MKIISGPNNKDVKIWKYLDFTKFMSLLETGSLYFARADLLADPHEGAYYKLNINGKPAAGNEAGGQKNDWRQCVFLNCWHQNEYESAAMWDLYLKSNEGMAIQSSFRRLSGCLKDNKNQDIILSKVKYVDYSHKKPRKKDPLQPFIQKRKSFEHETEIRALIRDPKSCARGGLFVPVDIHKLIEHIYVAPTAEDWIRGLVESILKRYELNISVIKSNLFDDPLL